jgi:hypothetical protein
MVYFYKYFNKKFYLYQAYIIFNKIFIIHTNVNYFQENSKFFLLWLQITLYFPARCFLILSQWTPRGLWWDGLLVGYISLSKTMTRNSKYEAQIPRWEWKNHMYNMVIASHMNRLGSLMHPRVLNHGVMLQCCNVVKIASPVTWRLDLVVTNTINRIWC